MERKKQGQTQTKLSKQIPAILIWFITALGVAYQFALQSTPNVMIHNLMQSFHTSKAGIGFLTSSFFYTYLLFQVPAGIFIDRFGVRKVLSVSVALAGFTCLLFANSRYFVVANFTRLAMGFFTAPCVPAVMFVASKRFTPAKFVILAGLAESIGMLGGAVGEGVLGSIVSNLGWRNTMSGCGLIGFAIAVLMFAFIRDNHNETQEESASSQLQHILQGFIKVMCNGQVWLIVFWGGLIFALLPSLAGLWIVQVMQELHHLPINEAALGSSVMFFGTAVGLPFWGWLSERIKRRKPLMWVATVLNLILSTSFVYIQWLNITFLYIQLTLMGFVSAVYVLAFALVRECTQSQVRASAMGLTNMMSMLIGAPLLQPLIGAILGKTATSKDMIAAYHIALTSEIVCVALALILIFFIKETYCRQQV